MLVGKLAAAHHANPMPVPGMRLAPLGACASRFSAPSDWRACFAPSPRCAHSTPPIRRPRSPSSDCRTCAKSLRGCTATSRNRMRPRRDSGLLRARESGALRPRDPDARRRRDREPAHGADGRSAQRRLLSPGTLLPGCAALPRMVRGRRRRAALGAARRAPRRAGGGHVPRVCSTSPVGDALAAEGWNVVPISLAERNRLGGTAAVIAKARLVVSNDPATALLAAAMRTPTARTLSEARELLARAA
jgi:hypothetical protein